MSMGSNVDDFAHEARLAGHLVELLGNREMGALSAELSPLVRAPGPERARRSLYGGVLTWLVTAIADVITARLGYPENGEAFVLEVHTTRGRHLGLDEVPASASRILRSVMALLAGDRVGARVQLDAAQSEPSPLVRAETLVDALVWLNVLLDVNLSAFPDRPPE